MTTDVRGGKTVQFKIGKYDLTLTPLSDKSIKKIDDYIQQRIISIAERASSTLSEDSRDRILSIAIREASIAFFRSKIGMQHMKTIDGLTFLLLMLARDHHPKLTVDDLSEEMNKSEVIEELTVAIQQLLMIDGMSSNGKPSDNTSKKKKRSALKKELENTNVT